jgi:hypothetical protein
MVIVYQSNTGFTRQYAEMLGKAEFLKVYPLEQADLPQETEVFYMGPLMAGRITGIDKAVKQFNVVGACGVGMSPPGRDVLNTMVKANFVPNAPLFYLQGGWAPKQVSWVQRQAVNMVTRSLRAQLEKKPDRTRMEQANLDMLKKGGSFVAFENLTTIRNWIKEQKNK